MVKLLFPYFVELVKSGELAGSAVDEAIDSWKSSATSSNKNAFRVITIPEEYKELAESLVRVL